ncbi:MAG: hypothetical protein ACYC5O_18805 [Anaerolineae bacterium]
MGQKPEVSRIYTMPFEHGLHQFLTEYIRVRARPDRETNQDYAVLNPDFTVADGAGGSWLADGKLEVCERQLSERQETANFRLATTDKMKGADIRALVKAASIPLKLSVSVMARQHVGSPSPSAVLPPIGLVGAGGKRLSKQFLARVDLKPSDLELLEWKMNEVVQRKHREGYRVRNISWTAARWNTYGPGRVAEAIAGETGGYCGEFMRWGNEWTQPFIEDLFESDVTVSFVMAGKRGSEATNNHVATLVILPGGDRYILDYWMSIRKREPVVFRTLDEWLSSCNSIVPDLIWANRQDILPTYGEDMDQLSQLTKTHGLEEGIKKYESFRLPNRPDAPDVQRRRRLIVRSFRQSPW